MLPVAALLPLPAQTVELRSGEVVIGRVVDFGDRSLKLEVQYPAPGIRTIGRADLDPRSLYTVLAARIDQDDARAHLGLAATCRDLGLFAHAIAESREAARRDAKLAAESSAMVRELHEAIGADLLRQAEDAAAESRLGSARLAAQAVLADYRDTASAKAAEQLLQRIATHGERPPRRASADEVAAAVESARKELERTEKDTRVPAHGAVRDQRALQRAIPRLEKVWQSIGDLEPEAKDVSATDRLTSTRAELRQRLVDAYLAMGSIYLQRRALPDAEEWCNRACELDAENQQLHPLHQLILQAKLVGGWRN
ncbi:MAG: hypothetical protein WAT39_21070 [Planctomycetota bacterium]